MNYTKLVLAVRFDLNSKLRDGLGHLADHIAYAHNSLFSPSHFTLAESGPSYHRFHNRGGDSLLISDQEFLLQQNVDTADPQELYNWAAAFSNIVVEQARTKHDLSRVNRFGFMVQLADLKGKASRPPLDNIIPDDFPEARDLALRFSHRLQTMNRHLKRGVDDYRNVIYTIQETEKREFLIALDYQEYFVPPLTRAEHAKIDFLRFFSGGLQYHRETFLPWLTRQWGIAEAGALSAPEKVAS